MDKRGAFFKALTVAVLVGAGTFFVKDYCIKQAATRANIQLKKGFASLAVETLEPFRHKFAGTPEGCAMLYSAYQGARRMELLEWATQACIDAGNESPEAYMNLAIAWDTLGNVSGSVAALTDGVQKFQKSPELFYTIAQLSKRGKRIDDAVFGYQKATQLAPKNPTWALEALRYFASEERWTEARLVAVELAPIETRDPEIKLLVARALQRGGDSSSAAMLVMQAKALMDASPALRGPLEKSYSDLLSASDTRGPASVVSRPKKEKH